MVVKIKPSMEMPQNKEVADSTAQRSRFQNSIDVGQSNRTFESQN